MKQLPKFRELLHQGRDNFFGRTNARQCISNDERLESGKRIEGNYSDIFFIYVFNIYSTQVSQRHGGRTKSGGVCYRKVDLMLSGNSSLKRNTIGLYLLTPTFMARKIKALLFQQHALEIFGFPNQACLSFFTNTTFKDRFNEYLTMPVQHRLDVLLGGVRAQHLSCWKTNEL